MKVTNVHKLPEAFVNFGKVNEYSHGNADMGVTTLIGSSQIRRLRASNAEEMVEDVSERIMSLLGTAIHNILEAGSSDEDIVEERLYGELLGTTFSGQVDLRSPVGGDGWRLSDYKTCAAFSIKKNPEGKPEWEKQLNVYRLLAELNGHHIKELEVVAIIRDWTRAAAERAYDYPQAAVVRIPVAMWKVDDTINFVENKIREHTSKEATLCTGEEMWESDPVFAVHKYLKNGTVASRASKLCDDELEAINIVSDMGGGGIAVVQTRPGRRARCEGNYCGVSEFCEQYATYQRGGR